MAQAPNSPLLSQPDTPDLSLGTCGFSSGGGLGVNKRWTFSWLGQSMKAGDWDLVNIKQMPNFCEGVHRGLRNQNVHYVQDTMT